MLSLIWTVPVQAQLFTPSVNFQTTLTDSSMVITLGQTTLSGSYQGYEASALFGDMLPDQSFEENDNISEIDDLINSVLTDYLRITPILSSAELTNVEKITLFDTSLFDTITENITDPEALFSQLQQYQDVTIQINNGMVLLGTGNTTIEVHCNAAYALSGLIEFPIDETMILPVIGMITDTPSSLLIGGNTSLLYPTLDTVTITILDEQGTVLSEKTGSTTFYLIEDQDLQLIDTSPVHLYPTDHSSNQMNLELTMHPASSSVANITSLLHLLDDIQFGDQKMEFPFDIQNDSFIEEMISTISPVSNGICIIMNYSSLSLNNQQFERKPFFLTRAEMIQMNVDTSTDHPKQVIGDGNLIFLGNHFYAPQASTDDHGLYLPILPIIFWLFEIGFFIAGKKYPIPDIEATWDKKMKVYGWIIHITMLIITFVLLDLIISSYIGLSFLASLFNQSFYLVTIGFLGFQMLLWTIGYIACTLPLQYIFKTLLRFIGLKKSGKSISKAIGIVGIPIFAGFYLILLINIVFFLVDIPLPTFPM